MSSISKINILDHIDDTEEWQYSHEPGFTNTFWIGIPLDSGLVTQFKVIEFMDANNDHYDTWFFDEEGNFVENEELCKMIEDFIVDYEGEIDD